MMCAPSFALFPSFYSQLRTSPLDTGPEQVHTCSRQPLKAEDERLLPPPDSTEWERSHFAFLRS